MSGHSKYFLAEQVKRRLKGSRPDATSIPNEEIYAAIGQHTSTLIRQTHFAETLPGGQTVPENTSLATYELDVVEYRNGTLSKCTLPTLPPALRRMQGIRAVRGMRKVENEWIVDEYRKFVPCPGDTFETINTHPVLSKIGGKTGFKNEAFDLIFNKNLLECECKFEKVEVKLLGINVDQYDNWAPLPITPEQEAELIERLVELFGGKRLPANTNTDLVNETARTQG